MEAENKPISTTVSAIYQEAQRNEVFGVLCYDFAKRKRTRETLTIRGLKARLEKQGADFSDEAYRQCLTFLAGLGLGKLALNNKQEIVALKNIPVTLQSIGEASGLRTKTLDTFKQQRKFKKLPGDKVPTSWQVTPKPEHQKVYTATLVIKHGDNPLALPGPIKLSAMELGDFLLEFANMTKKTSH